MLARDHQDVDGRLRVDVTEGDHEVVLEDDVRRDVTRGDGAEQADPHETARVAGQPGGAAARGSARSPERAMRSAQATAPAYRVRRTRGPMWTNSAPARRRVSTSREPSPPSGPMHNASGRSGLASTAASGLTPRKVHASSRDPGSRAARASGSSTGACTRGITPRPSSLDDTVAT